MFHFREYSRPLCRSACPWLLWLAVAVPPAGAADTPLLGLEDAVAGAVASNPGLAAMQARAGALAAVPSQAGSLPDPMLSLDVMNLPTDGFALDREPMSMVQLWIEQALPYPGKLALQARAAERDADAAASDSEEARLRLVRDVRQAWWQVHYLDRALEIVARNRDLLRQFVDIARTKYKVGDGLQQEVLLAQVELSRLLDRDIDLQGQRQAQVAHLNALLDRDAGAAVELPAQVDEALPVLLPDPQLLDRADQGRSLLAQRRHEVEAARTRQELAQRERYPDFRVGVSYGLRDGREPDGSARSDFMSVGVAMSLPLYAGRKQNRFVEQRSRELLQQQYQLQDDAARVREEITAAAADYRRAAEQVRLYRTGILPQARQSVASMLSGYQVNKVDFLNLVRAEITLYDYEMQYWESFSEAHQALARLAAAVGGEVTE